MEFSKPEDGPISTYGVPKNMLLDVRISMRTAGLLLQPTVIQFRIMAKPCAVVRDITLSTVQTLAEAEVKSSRETRAVLSAYMRSFVHRARLTVKQPE